MFVGCTFKILEESDEDSGDDWVPNGRRRGSSEEGGFGSGGPGSGRAPAGGSNSTSSLPRSSPSSDEPLNLPPAKRQHSEHSPPVIRGTILPPFQHRTPSH